MKKFDQKQQQENKVNQQKNETVLEHNSMEIHQEIQKYIAFYFLEKSKCKYFLLGNYDIFKKKTGMSRKQLQKKINKNMAFFFCNKKKLKKNVKK